MPPASSALVLLGLLVLLPPRVLAADGWPGLRGPDGSGTVTTSLPPGEGALDLEPVWRIPLGSGYSSPVVSGELVVAMFAAGESDVVAAFDATNGEERWRFPIDDTYTGHDGSHDGPISTPLLVDGRVFALAPRGRFVALDLESGREIWSLDLVESMATAKPWYGFGTSPVAAGDRIVVELGGQEGAVAAFDPATGEIVWRSGSDGVLYQTPVVTTLGGRRQVVVAGNETVVGLDPENGRELWSWAHGGGPPMGAMSMTPLPVGRDRLFLTHAHEASSLISITPSADGLVAASEWEARAIARTYSPAVAWDGHVYGYTSRFLSCLDLETGATSWRSRAPGDGFVIAIDGQLVVLTKEGTLHVGAASPEEWTEAASLELFDDATWGIPAYADGRLFLRSHGELARVDLVRRPHHAAAADEASVPKALGPLLAALEGAEDRALAVDGFLADRALPLIDGREVVFLWRGQADDVGIAGDMVGARREEPMNRLEGTDVWWWATDLEAGARVSYVYFVDFEPTPDPAHENRTLSTIFGPDMNFVSEGPGIEMSSLAMPGWSPPSHLLAPAPEQPRGRLVEHLVSFQPPRPPAEDGGAEAPAPEPIEIDLRVWTPPGYDDGEEQLPVVYVHGQAALEHGGWTNTLDNLVGAAFEPVLVAFVEPPEGLRSGQYVEAFAERIVPFVDATYRTLKERDARASVGQGDGGFVAFLAAFAHPDLVGRVGGQSFYALDVTMNALYGAMGDATPADVPLRIYLDWGRWDLQAPHEGWDLREMAERWYRQLIEKGWEVAGGEVLDGADWPNWSTRTDRLLAALFPGADA